VITTDPIRQAFRLPSSGEEPQPLDRGPALDPDAAIPIPGAMSFDELVAGLNPLHHVPVVGMLYRAATGAEIHPVLRIVGAGLVGGPVGLVVAAAIEAVGAFRPAERMRAHLAGQPDPLQEPATRPAATGVAEAYRRWGETARA